MTLATLALMVLLTATPNELGNEIWKAYIFVCGPAGCSLGQDNLGPYDHQEACEERAAEMEANLRRWMLQRGRRPFVHAFCDSEPAGRES